VRLASDAGAEGSVTISVELFGYDEAVSIAAPPADQVEEGTLPFPSP
jgi:hypothetical protein